VLEQQTLLWPQMLPEMLALAQLLVWLQPLMRQFRQT
jgi:hypothetical protein